MERNFDIDKIPKRMPYPPLEEGYFERFNAETLARINDERVRSRRRWSLLLSSSIAIAATVAVVLTTMLIDNPTECALETFDSNLELYVEALSDEELTTLYSSIESSYDFYANL